MDSEVTIESLRAAARALTVGDCRSRLMAIQTAQDALDAAKAVELSVLESSRDYELDGASTLKVWARNKLRLDAGESAKLVAAGSTMRDLPAVAEAAASGRIRLDHVAAFSYGLKHIGPDTICDAETWLLKVALTCEPAELRRTMRAFREAVYPDELDEAWADGMDKEDFQINPVPTGWHVNGFLNTATGAKLKAVLDALGAPHDKDDTRPGSVRRVTALDTMLTTILESGLPSDKGIRPHLSIIIDAETGGARLAGFGAIGPKLLHYLSCLSDLTPILTTTGDYQQAKVLNVGRTQRRATLKQRRAIIARQNGECAAPGCHHTHLEIHHTIWWTHGGHTNLDQMIGLCVRCHHLIHREHLHVSADGTGGFAFTNQHHRPFEPEHRRHVPPQRLSPPRRPERRMPLRT